MSSLIAQYLGYGFGLFFFAVVAGAGFSVGARLVGWLAGDKDDE
jgi:ABC-type Na+ efflux pump permease subunit